MNEPIRVNSEHVVYSFSPNHLPIVEVDPGAALVVETRDTYGGQFYKSLDVQQYLGGRKYRPLNPATGPIFVRSALPGDGLDVTITKIDIGPTGFVAALPGAGVLRDTPVVPRISPFQVRADGLWFEGRVRLPIRPMVGTIGVAPSSGDISSLQLGYHGGNLDFNDVREGTTLHFPVFVPGALLALGDAHASMGYCEVHSGVNIDATVHLSVDRVPDAGWERPWFETAAEVMTIGVEDRLEDAIHEATRAMVALLQRRLGVSYTEAVILAGACVDIRLGQAANYGVKVSAYAAFPKSALR